VAGVGRPGKASGQGAAAFLKWPGLSCEVITLHNEIVAQSVPKLICGTVSHKCFSHQSNFDTSYATIGFGTKNAPKSPLKKVKMRFSTRSL
jgi:hypothetical protein